ncbi:glucose 1-dehydrogenase [Microbacterium sp. Kw_RZR3]|uniref:glucose 1-dehydrogenase n=1 Tax=Microbacterium sp. Kw_RZR3 TaxID=3032903 RepID=UPI0023DB38B8|nr:glucose 1-dehydrogenase [Microbacterium sp. Kw_RZR3]MDF2045981.1 glucose 1-dehydrogenase [Microbacterium sp. Kw_RZR3]
MSKSRWFDGKAGLVTGAASGIGRASALAFAAAGGSVVVADLERARPGGEETVRLIIAAGGEARFVPVDVARGEDVERLVDTTIATYGRLDFAHNNAGTVAEGFTADVEEEAWDRVFDVNIKGVWLCMKHELRHMQDHGGGAIVNTASVSGLTGTALTSPYVATKHAVVGLTKVSAGEYANLGVRINAVAPGAIWTPLMQSAPEPLQQMMLAPQPLHRFGTAEEVAEAVTWLCSPKASFVTGVTLPVDGGLLATPGSYSPFLSPSLGDRGEA